MAFVKTKTLVRARRLRRKLTNAETILWSRLRNDVHGLKFRKQHPVGPYIADFACLQARLVVEVDGATHGSEEEQLHDARRDAYLSSKSWRIVRLSNDAVYHSLDRVLDAIYQSALS